MLALQTMNDLCILALLQEPRRRLTNVADTPAKFFLHCHDLVYNLMGLQVPGKAPLAGGTEGASQGAPNL